MKRKIDSKFSGTLLKVLAAAAAGIVICLQAHYLSASTTASRRPRSEQSNLLVEATNEFKALTEGWETSTTSSVVAQRRRRNLQWHGRVYEFFRNDAIDAIPHQVKQNGQTQSPLRRNQFGFDVSGHTPIPRLVPNPNNTFVMVAYEGVREEAFQASLHTIPTSAERTGDFSQTVDPAGHLLPIYDPATTVPNPAYNPSLPVSASNLQYQRSTFPGNIIPQDRLVQPALQAMSLYPLPNTDIGPFLRNNYFANLAEVDDADGIRAKVTETINPRNQVTGNANISRGLLAASPYFPTIATPTTPPQHFFLWSSGLNYTYTANAHMLNSASISLASDVVRSGTGSEAPFPVFSLDGSYLPMGVAYPASRNARNSVALRDGISIHQGKHSLNFSLSYDKYQVNTLSPEYPSGYFQFGAGLTGLPGIIDTGDPFASMLLGLAQYSQQTITLAPSYFRDSYLSAAASDSYQATKNLIFNFDLTFSRRTPRAEKYNRESTVDPSVYNSAARNLGAQVFAGRNGVPQGLREPNFDLDPSASVAWNPRGSSNTVVRAAFSRGHSMIPIYNGQWATQGFNAQQTFVSANTQLTPALALTTGIPPYTTPLPDFSPSVADNTVADLVDLSGQEPVYRSASLSIERDLPFSLVVTTGMEYGDGHNLLVGNSAANPNAIDPSDLSYGDALYNQTFRQSLQPYPQYLGFQLYGLYPAGKYQRIAEYVRVEKQASHGLSFTGTYEASRQFDDYSSLYGNQYLLNLNNNWALTSYNPPRFFQLSYTYKLPFGPNEPLLNLYGWAKPLVSGWSVYGSAYWNSGTPLSMHPEFNNTGGVVPNLFVNVVPGISPQVANPGPSQWFNPAAFIQPPNFTLGDGVATEPNLLGPGYNNLNLSVNKRLPIGGTRALQFSATAFNLMNHANWNMPDTGIGSTAAPNANAGRIIGSYGGRIVQLEMEFDF
ncbi:MAG: hypothetical protein KGM47_15295 [Acidobacteriota bacterium]|nr:hypothetical protein [Acidobacteriota bacterium]